MTTTLIIMAAGLSSRMKASVAAQGLTAEDLKDAESLTKGLISVGEGERPLLDYILNNAEAAGFREIILVTGNGNEAFKRLYGQQERGNPHRGIHVSYAIQSIPAGRSKPYGTADAVYQALLQYPSLQKDSFAVCNCDNLYSAGACRMLAETPSAHAFIAYDREGLEFPAEKIARFALCVLDSNDNLIRIVEKPDASSLDQYRDRKGVIRVSMNIFKFSGDPFFHYLKNCPVTPGRDEKELATAITAMIADHPGTMAGIPLHEHVPDLTEKNDILAMREYLKNRV